MTRYNLSQSTKRYVFPGFRGHGLERYDGRWVAVRWGRDYVAFPVDGGNMQRDKGVTLNALNPEFFTVFGEDRPLTWPHLGAIPPGKGLVVEGRA